MVEICDILFIIILTTVLLSTKIVLTYGIKYLYILIVKLCYNIKFYVKLTHNSIYYYHLTFYVLLNLIFYLRIINFGYISTKHTK